MGQTTSAKIELGTILLEVNGPAAATETDEGNRSAPVTSTEVYIG